MSKHSNDKGSVNKDEAKPDLSLVQPCADANETQAGNPVSEAAQGAAPKEGSELESARTRIAALEKEVSELKDQYLRKLADYENFRKRMFREKEEAIQFANASILVDLVQVLDDFDRAIKSAEASKDFKTLHDGVQLIERQFFSLLENKYKLKRFDSVGQAFDPNRHEALSVERSADPEHLEETVIEEYLKGYQLADRVIRSAKVRVRQPAVAPEASAGGNGKEVE